MWMCRCGYGIKSASVILKIRMWLIRICNLRIWMYDEMCVQIFPINHMKMHFQLLVITCKHKSQPCILSVCGTQTPKSSCIATLPQIPYPVGSGCLVAHRWTKIQALGYLEWVILLGVQLVGLAHIKTRLVLRLLASPLDCYYHFLFFHLLCCIKMIIEYFP